MVQFSEGFDDSRPQRIQMNVAHQFQKIDVFLTKNRFIAVLEQMAASVASPVEASGIAAQQSSHDGSHGNITGFQQEVKMIADQRPGITPRLALLDDFPQPLQKIIPVRIVTEDLSALKAAHHDVVHRT